MELEVRATISGLLRRGGRHRFWGGRVGRKIVGEVVPLVKLISPVERRISYITSQMMNGKIKSRRSKYLRDSAIARNFYKITKPKSWERSFASKSTRNGRMKRKRRGWRRSSRWKLRSRRWLQFLKRRKRIWIECRRYLRNGLKNMIRKFVKKSGKNLGGNCWEWIRTYFSKIWDVIFIIEMAQNLQCKWKVLEQFKRSYMNKNNQTLAEILAQKVIKLCKSIQWNLLRLLATIWGPRPFLNLVLKWALRI